MLELLGFHIRTRREALGLSQAELADLVVGNPERSSYVSLVENGKTIIDVQRLSDFAQALQCPASHLLQPIAPPPVTRGEQP